MDSHGYVAVFAQPHTDASIQSILQSWFARFEKIEQVCPGLQAGNSTITLASPKEMLPADHLQFRILQGSDFAWAYLTRGRRVIETTGLDQGKISLCLDILLELPEVTEIVEQHDDRRLDELERDGLM